eukprot:scaffold13663_cov78-Skeletonema_dohrnii-CCMP3373.AAC.2
MKLYDLPIDIPGKMNVRNKTGVSSTMNVANLTKKTIEVINEVYAGDFALFNYSKVVSPDEFLSSTLPLVYPPDFTILPLAAVFNVTVPDLEVLACDLALALFAVFKNGYS